MVGEGYVLAASAAVCSTEQGIAGSLAQPLKQINSRQLKNPNRSHQIVGLWGMVRPSKIGLRVLYPTRFCLGGSACDNAIATRRRPIRTSTPAIFSDSLRRCLSPLGLNRCRPTACWLPAKLLTDNWLPLARNATPVRPTAETLWKPNCPF